MATGAGPEQVDEGSHELGLNVVFDALVPVADKYEFFGIQIGVEMDEVEKIQMQYTDPNRCLLRILRIRLKQIPALTWNDIDRALRSRSVGEGRLANAIRNSHDSSLGTALDQEPPRKASEKVERKPKSTKKEKHVREGRTQKVRNEQERDSDEEVSESETRSEKPKRTQHKVKIIKKRSEPEKEYKRDMKQEAAHEASQVRKELTEQTEQKEVPEMSESESSVSSSEEIVKANKSETHAEDSSEQEQNSDEEVRGKEYQKNSEQTTGDEYASESETELKGKTMKAKRSQSEYGGKEKQKKDQQSDTGNRHTSNERYTQKHKQFKEIVPKKSEIQSSLICSEDEMVSSLYYRGKSGKSQTAEETEPGKQMSRKEAEGRKGKATAKMPKQNIAKEKAKHVLEEQYSDEEVRKKPALKHMTPKQVQTKSKSKEKNEKSYSPCTSEKVIEDVFGTTNVPKMRKTEHRKVNQNTDGKDKAIGTKALLQKTKAMKEKTSICTHVGKDDRKTEVNEATNKASKGKYLKVDSGSRKETRNLVNEPREMKVSSERKQVATPSSCTTQEDSEEEEWDSDGRSKDEEDRDSEQSSSIEEEETEHNDGSSSATSGEEVACTKKLKTKTNAARGTSQQIITELQVAHTLGESDPGIDQEEHNVKQKKRSRRKYRESSMSPTARGSSSPSTSQEENPPSTKEHRVKDKKGKSYKKGKSKKGEIIEANDSSPECDRLSESEKLIVNLFERFYGQLCCEISSPVETAAQLQKRGLISKAAMKDMIRSPESQQVKTISLVDILDEVINSQPDSLFMFIEVLLENDNLQRVGREMLREAGK